jgi:hypothetical protein
MITDKPDPRAARVYESMGKDRAARLQPCSHDQACPCQEWIGDPPSATDLGTLTSTHLVEEHSRAHFAVGHARDPRWHDYFRRVRAEMKRRGQR